MSSVQTVTSEKGAGASRGTIAGAIHSLSRRLSGTFVGTGTAGRSSLPLTISKDKRPPIFSYDEETGQMRIGGVLVSDLAEQYGTPLYVYDVNRIMDNYHMYVRSLQSSVANSNFTIAYGVKV